MGKTNRRSFLKNFGLGAFGLTGLASGNHSKETENFSIVHLTDTHVTSRRNGDQGYRACVASINELDSAPDLVLMGADMVFEQRQDSLYKSEIQITEGSSGQQ